MTWRRLVAATGIFIAVEIAAVALFLGPKLDELDAVRADTEKLKEDYVSKKRMAVNLDVHREQMRLMDGMLRETLFDLPDESERVFAGVRSAAIARGLRVDVLAPGQQEWRREFYAETAARVVVTGHFHRVAAFVSDVAHLPASVRMDTFVIERAPQPGQVTLDGVVRAYRYLSPEEFAAMRKAASAKP